MYPVIGLSQHVVILQDTVPLIWERLVPRVKETPSFLHGPFARGDRKIQQCPGDHESGLAEAGRPWEDS